MNKILFSLFLSLAFFAACKQDNKSGTAAGPATREDFINQLAGNWIDVDFCSRANQYGSVLSAQNNAHKPYAYSLSFNPAKPDSVSCYNGAENWSVPVTFRDDTLELKGARGPNTSIFLVYTRSETEKDIVMYDRSPSGMQMDRFIKSKAGTPDAASAFAVAINHNLFSGVFLPKGQPNAKPIQMTPTGRFTNFKDFDRFEVCTAGDCFVLGPSDKDDVLMLWKKDQEDNKVWCNFQYGNQNDTLYLYQLNNVNPEEKGNYKRGKLLYTFLRKKPN
jgi:hypothetical protein